MVKANTLHQLYRQRAHEALHEARQARERGHESIVPGLLQSAQFWRDKAKEVAGPTLA